MCERLKTHVFLGAPSFASDPDEAVGACSSRVSAWTRVDLSWQDRRLRPAQVNRTKCDTVEHQLRDSAVDRLALNTDTDHSSNRHPFSEADGNQSPNRGTEKEEVCSVSILEYLDSCFPQTEPQQPRASSLGLSHNTQYLTTWILSQAMVLRESQGVAHHRTSTQALSTSSSTPELFSPVLLTASPANSAELFTQLRPTPRAEEGCVILQATTNGLLCSQAAERQDTPVCKKSRLSEVLGAKTSADNLSFGDLDPTTPLAHCVKLGLHYSVLVAVVHPCHLKEIKLKSGNYIPLASIIVTDQSGVEIKVALWRFAAFWVLPISPGDILLITELQMNKDSWRGESVLHSTFHSKLLNLGRVPVPSSLTVSQQARAHSLHMLYDFLRKQRPQLVALPAPPTQKLSHLPYATIRSMRVNTLVHMLLRVTHTHRSTVWQTEADSRWRSAVQHKAVVSVEQPGGQQGALVLWGAAVDWLQRFSRDTAAVWDFHVLLVRDGVTPDLPELHSTPWSSVQPLDHSDQRAQDFLQPQRAAGRRSSLELDMSTLLSQKYSGEVVLRVQVDAFHFHRAALSQTVPGSILDSSSTAADVLLLLSGDITYTGCGRCAAELDTDSNGIYCPCYPCLPHTAVSRFYRPAVLTVSDSGHHRLFVQVPSVLLEKILSVPPDKLRGSASGSEMKHIELAAQRVQSLLFLPKKTFTVTVQSHFLCDENSVPIFKDFTLLDLQFPT